MRPMLAVGHEAAKCTSATSGWRHARRSGGRLASKRRVRGRGRVRVTVRVRVRVRARVRVRVRAP